VSASWPLIAPPAILESQNGIIDLVPIEHEPNQAGLIGTSSSFQPDRRLVLNEFDSRA
jgi:hypothetical protein